MGRYVADSYCARAKLVIELDGSQPILCRKEKHTIASRTAGLEEYGITVLRFSNIEVDRHFEAVCSLIDETVQTMDEELKKREALERAPSLRELSSEARRRSERMNWNKYGSVIVEETKNLPGHRRPQRHGAKKAAEHVMTRFEALGYAPQNDPQRRRACLPWRRGVRKTACCWQRTWTRAAASVCQIEEPTAA